jgi:hypothetical protein
MATMNKKWLLNITGLVLLAIALLPAINIPNIIPNPLPSPAPSVNLDVEKPSDDILAIVSPISKYITDKEDKVNLAVFNYVFSKRLVEYNTDSQKLQDVYVLAGEDFFKGSLSGKYKNLAAGIQQLFENVIGDKNHILSSEEKIELKNTFAGLAWSLIQ